MRSINQFLSKGSKRNLIINSRMLSNRHHNHFYAPMEPFSHFKQSEGWKVKYRVYCYEKVFQDRLWYHRPGVGIPQIASLKIVRRQSRLSSSNALFFISTINAFLELKHTSVFLTNDFFEIGPSLHDNKGVNGRFKGALLLCLIETWRPSCLETLSSLRYVCSSIHVLSMVFNIS